MATTQRTKKATKIDPHTRAVMDLEAGALLEYVGEICVRTDMDYDSAQAAVSIDTGSCYYLKGYEEDVVLVEPGAEYEFVQE